MLHFSTRSRYCSYEFVVTQFSKQDRLQRPVILQINHKCATTRWTCKVKLTPTIKLGQLFIEPWNQPKNHNALWKCSLLDWRNLRKCSDGHNAYSHVSNQDNKMPLFKNLMGWASGIGWHRYVCRMMLLFLHKSSRSIVEPWQRQRVIFVLP